MLLGVVSKVSIRWFGGEDRSYSHVFVVGQALKTVKTSTVTEVIMPAPTAALTYRHMGAATCFDKETSHFRTFSHCVS